MYILSHSAGLLPLAGALVYGRSVDVKLLILFIAWKKWDAIQQLASYIDPTIVTSTAKITTTLFILLQVYRYIRNLQQTSSPCDYPIKPMLFPCETAHVRMFPKKHGFAYSYLLAGIPVGWSGSVGGMISSDLDKTPACWYSHLFSMDPGSAWYTVNGDDYLERGHVEGGLQGKLHSYLERQGVDFRQYAYVYLLTAARFLGYASNPVSVWHLYSSNKELKALILEVNNTFDEKRIYFLEPGHEDPPQTEDEILKSTRYTGTWPKDFYVSTFNSRNGSYSLSAHDPLFPQMSNAGPINTTITLSNSNAHAKLIARVYSSGPALDPTTMTVWQKTIFLASWWWVGLATFPRTVKEALTLLFTKKMPWAFRPEPRKETMSRRADSTETMIESHFRAYLRNQIESSDGDIVLRYIPAGQIGADAREELMTSPSAQLLQGTIPTSEIRILTPLFYSRLVQYSCVNEALLSESASATVSLAPLNLLTKLSFTPSTKTQHSEDVSAAPMLDLEFLSFLRKRPSPIPVPKKEQDDLKPLEGLPKDVFHGSASLDTFILKTASRDEWRKYVKKVLKLMIAEHVALGWMEILDLEIFLLRAGFAWAMVKMFLP